MNRWNVLAIIFAFLTFGAAKETYSILVSDEPNVAPNKTGLIIMGSIFTAVLIFLKIRFWRKASGRGRY